MKRLNNHNKTGSDIGVYFDQGIKWYSHTDIKFQTLTSNNPKVAKYVHSCWTIIISERCRCIFTITQWNTCFHVYCVTCVIIYVHSCWSFRFISVSRSLASITFKWWFPRTIFAGKHFWHSIQTFRIFKIIYSFGEMHFEMRIYIQMVMVIFVVKAMSRGTQKLNESLAN